MERKRCMRTTATPVSSNDIKRTRTRWEILAAGHEARVREIENMHLSDRPKNSHHNSYNNVRVKNFRVKKQNLPYIILWGKRVYITEDRVEATMDCGFKVYID